MVLMEGVVPYVLEQGQIVQQHQAQSGRRLCHVVPGDAGQEFFIISTHHHSVSSGLSCSHGLLSILATLRLIWASQYHTLTQPWLCPRLGRPCMAPCEQRHSVGRFRRSFHPKRRLIGCRYRYVARWAGCRGAQHTCGAGGVGAGRMRHVWIEMQL